MPVEPFWYRNAVIYQLHVRSFCDSSGDGIGDFNGLITRLDYLEELGVTAVWLLPFYPSPLKDDGYDIADYTGVHPSYGTIEDARRFIREAHRRGIRVITELVINHTSDQHPWFQRARLAPRGSPERDFYVWSDTNENYSGVRVIFKDFEPSNWTFDRVAGQFYWHRFFHHQPDLNFDNPRVHQAVLKICDFWMDAGVDGVRLDAVPYLYEREGTSCENLPETHAFLKKLRKHVDTRWPGRMLLAEANQWPEDAIAYFGSGEGDECHMNFHFPLMPRLFMALRMEDRYPIIDILEQTPPLPATAQWAMFLRNHDELTLEMVTDEERDYMWRVYASDPAARINMGIRRRLAPLLSNNRRKIELLNALLFSMPGTPVLYYGDEIGMGDNIFLGDRNGVRTPMQWSADRNAGFSRANPQRLFLPIIIDPEYHYEAINAESQQANPSSLLWWMKRLIALRKNHPVLGSGEIQFLTPANRKVLAFLRRDDNEQVLVVANLSRFAQPIELDLSAFGGSTPVEMFGNVRFPTVADDGRYTLSIGPHGCYYFLLEPAATKAAEPLAVPEVRIAAPGKSLLAHSAFERAIESRLPRVLPRHRWFVSNTRTIRALHVVDRVAIRTAATNAVPEIHRALFLTRIEYAEGEPDLYALPMTAIPADSWGSSPANDANILMYVIDASDNRWIIQDGMADVDFVRLLLQIVMRGREISGEFARLEGRRVHRNGIRPPDLASLPITLPEKEQSNSVARFGDQLIFKLYRCLPEGINPELEIGEHLTQVRFPHAAPVAGAIEIIGRGSPRTIAIVTAFVPNEGSSWSIFLDYAHRYYERLDAMTQEQSPTLIFPSDMGSSGAGDDPPEPVTAAIAEPLDLARLLARRTADLHIALADDRGNPAFAPESYSLAYQRSLLQSMRNTTRATMQTLAQHVGSLQGEARELGQWLLTHESDALNHFRQITSRPIRAPRIRCHGDYHLGQVLWTGKDFVITSFEGEPTRSVGERRLKRSSLRDVAGMVRSFDYCACAALRRHWELLRPGAGNTALQDRHLSGASIWSAWLGREFVRAYVARLRELRNDLLPPNLTDAQLVLNAWLLEKALYEVRHELNSRLDWVEIPLRSATSMLGRGTASVTATTP